MREVYKLLNIAKDNREPEKRRESALRSLQTCLVDQNPTSVQLFEARYQDFVRDLQILLKSDSQHLYISIEAARCIGLLGSHLRNVNAERFFQFLISNITTLQHMEDGHSALSYLIALVEMIRTCPQDVFLLNLPTICNFLTMLNLTQLSKEKVQAVLNFYSFVLSKAGAPQMFAQQQSFQYGIEQIIIWVLKNPRAFNQSGIGDFLQNQNIWVLVNGHAYLNAILKAFPHTFEEPEIHTLHLKNCLRLVHIIIKGMASPLPIAGNIHHESIVQLFHVFDTLTPTIPLKVIIPWVQTITGICSFTSNSVNGIKLNEPIQKSILNIFKTLLDPAKTKELVRGQIFQIVKNLQGCYNKIKVCMFPILTEIVQWPCWTNLLHSSGEVVLIILELHRDLIRSPHGVEVADILSNMFYQRCVKTKESEPLAFTPDKLYSKHYCSISFAFHLQCVANLEYSNKELVLHVIRGLTALTALKKCEMFSENPQIVQLMVRILHHYTNFDQWKKMNRRSKHERTPLPSQLEVCLHLLSSEWLPEKGGIIELLVKWLDKILEQSKTRYMKKELLNKLADVFTTLTQHENGQVRMRIAMSMKEILQDLCKDREVLRKSYIFQRWAQLALAKLSDTDPRVTRSFCKVLEFSGACIPETLLSKYGWLEGTSEGGLGHRDYRSVSLLPLSSSFKGPQFDKILAELESPDKPKEPRGRHHASNVLLEDVIFTCHAQDKIDPRAGGNQHVQADLERLHITVSELCRRYTSDTFLMDYWLQTEMAKYLVRNRLKSNLGGAKETMMYFHKMVSNQAIQKPERKRHLIQAMDIFEKFIYNAAQGCQSLCSPATTAQKFFNSNRKVCDGFFMKIRPSLFELGKGCGSLSMAVITGMHVLNQKKSRVAKATSAENSLEATVDILKDFISVARNLVDLAEEDCIYGLGLWLMRHVLSPARDREFPPSASLMDLTWIQALCVEAKGEIEQAAEIYMDFLDAHPDYPAPLRHILQDFAMNCFVNASNWGGVSRLSEDLYNGVGRTSLQEGYVSALESLDMGEPDDALFALSKWQLPTDDTLDTQIQRCMKLQVKSLVQKDCIPKLKDLVFELQKNRGTLLFQDQFHLVMMLQCARALELQDTGVLNAFIRETSTSNEVFCHPLEPKGKVALARFNKSLSVPPGQWDMVSRVIRGIDGKSEESKRDVRRYELSYVRSMLLRKNYGVASRILSTIKEKDSEVSFLENILLHAKDPQAGLKAMIELGEELREARSHPIDQSNCYATGAKWINEDKDVDDTLMQLLVRNSSESFIPFFAEKKVDLAKTLIWKRTTQATQENHTYWLEYGRSLRHLASMFLSPDFQPLRNVISKQVGPDNLDEACETACDIFQKVNSRVNMQAKENDPEAWRGELSRTLEAVLSSKPWYKQEMLQSWLPELETFRISFIDLQRQALRAYEQAIDIQELSMSCTIGTALEIFSILTTFGSDLQHTLKEVLKMLNAQVWRKMIPQLLSRLGHTNKFVKKQLEGLVMGVAKTDPSSIVFPVVCARNVQADGNSAQGIKIYHYIYDLLKKDEDLTSVIQDIEDIVREFMRISCLWEDLWVQEIETICRVVPQRLGLLNKKISMLKEKANVKLKGDTVVVDYTERGLTEEISNEYKLLMAPVADILNSLERTINTMPMTPHERKFQETYSRTISVILRRFRYPVEVWSPETIWNDVHALLMELQKKFTQNNTWSLEDASPRLHQLSLNQTNVSIPGMLAGNKVVSIARMQNKIEIFRTKTRPKKIVVVGDDGQKYQYLLKAREDLHLDERIMQILEVCNYILQDRRGKMSTSELRLRTYSVVPLAARVGLIRWIDNTLPLLSVVRSWQERQKNYASYNSDKKQPFRSVTTEAFRHYLAKALQDEGIPKETHHKNVPIKIFRKVHKHLCEKVPIDLLEKELWCSSSVMEEFYTKRNVFARSMATNSMIGSIIGLGDRHLGNILVDFNTGEIAHIDYNACFEKGMRFRIQERVPFRLTRTLRGAMGTVGGLEGSFTRSCEYALTAFREEVITLGHLLEVFVYDPLAEWTISESKDFLDKKHNDLKLSLEYIATHLSKTLRQRKDLHDGYTNCFMTFSKCFRDEQLLGTIEDKPMNFLDHGSWSEISDKQEELQGEMERIDIGCRKAVKEFKAVYQTVRKGVKDIKGAEDICHLSKTANSIPTRGSSVVVFERVRASHNSISTLLTNHLAVMRQLTFNIREYAAIMRKFTESPYLHCGVAQYWHTVFLEIQNSNSAEGVNKQCRWKNITEKEANEKFSNLLRQCQLMEEEGLKYERRKWNKGDTNQRKDEYYNSKLQACMLLLEMWHSTKSLMNQNMREWPRTEMFCRILNILECLSVLYPKCPLKDREQHTRIDKIFHMSWDIGDLLNEWHQAIEKPLGEVIDTLRGTMGDREDVLNLWTRLADIIKRVDENLPKINKQDPETAEEAYQEIQACNDEWRNMVEEVDIMKDTLTAVDDMFSRIEKQHKALDDFGREKIGVFPGKIGYINDFSLKQNVCRVFVRAKLQFYQRFLWLVSQQEAVVMDSTLLQELSVNLGLLELRSFIDVYCKCLLTPIISSIIYVTARSTMRELDRNANISKESELRKQIVQLARQRPTELNQHFKEWFQSYQSDSLNVIKSTMCKRVSPLFKETVAQLKNYQQIFEFLYRPTIFKNTSSVNFLFSRLSFFRTILEATKRALEKEFKTYYQLESEVFDISSVWYSDPDGLSKEAADKTIKHFRETLDEKRRGRQHFLEETEQLLKVSQAIENAEKMKQGEVGAVAMDLKAQDFVKRWMDLNSIGGSSVNMLFNDEEVKADTKSATLEKLKEEVGKTVVNLQQLRKKHALIDNELFKMLDMLCKSTDSSNPFHMLARQFTTDSGALINSIRTLCKDARQDVWEEHSHLLEKSDSLARLGWKLEAAIRCIGKEESLQTLLQFTLEQRSDKTLLERKSAFGKRVVKRVLEKLRGSGAQVRVGVKVKQLIKEATSLDNLSRMYEGWTSWI